MFLQIARRRRNIFWGVFPPIFRTQGEKCFISPHFPDPGGKLEKAVSPHRGGKKDTPGYVLEQKFVFWNIFLNAIYILRFKIEHLPMFLNTCGALKFKIEQLPMVLNTCGALIFKIEHLPMFLSTCGAQNSRSNTCR